MLSPLGHPTFRTLWLANVVGNLGSLIQAVGAAWLMTTITTSEGMVALVQASIALPIMIFSLASGAIADNFDRRRVMLIAQVFMLTVSVTLTAVAWLDLLTPWSLLAFTFLVGCGTALNNPSWQASVGDIVPRDVLPSAVALNGIGFNLTRSVGPAIGGAILAAAGAAAAFAVNSVSYLALILALLRWRPSIPVAALPREDLGQAMGAGLRYVAMSPNLLKVMLRAFLFGTSSISVMALLPLVAQRMTTGGPLAYGVLLGVFGMGAVAGGTALSRLRGVASSETIVRLSFGAFALAAMLLALGDGFALSALGALIGGASWVAALSLFNVTVQLSTPRWVLGRALALYQTAAFGGMTLGSWLWGAAAEEHGLAQALAAASAMLIAGGLVGLRLPLPDFADLNLDPLNRFKEPSLALDLKPRSGPIVIEVEYLIREADVPVFLETMAARQRIRLRDGARHWTLLRDLEAPELWVESYQTPTWVEYLRHNQRRTLADAEVSDTILALHRGDHPKVRRLIVRQARWTGEEPATKALIDLH